ncbi:MAG: HyaD/HybD family hydrogenase maturation endopeptidase [Campylobacterales bacterium]|nr:HyaD/HybD family hydrogenase maturation endopeptidase [Campylobacterales bacterium]
MKILLLGIGNILFGDEGVGVHFINYITQKYRFEGKNTLDIVDGGTLAQGLIPIIVEYDRLIIVDTINAPKAKAGELYFFDFEEIPNTIDWQGSAHEVEMLHTLNLINLAGDRPLTMIMGIVPTVIEIMDFSLSDEVINAIPLMEETLLNYLKTLEIESIIENNRSIDSVISNVLR